MGDRWRRRTLPRERPSPSTGHADAIKRRERVRDVLENEHLKSTNRKRGLAPQLQSVNALVAAVATALERWIKKVSCGPNETGKEGPLAGGVSGRSCLTQMVHVFPFAADSPRHLPHRSRCAQACGQKTILQAAPPVGSKGLCAAFLPRPFLRRTMRKRSLRRHHPPNHRISAHFLRKASCLPYTFQHNVSQRVFGEGLGTHRGPLHRPNCKQKTPKTDAETGEENTIPLHSGHHSPSPNTLLQGHACGRPAGSRETAYGVARRTPASACSHVTPTPVRYPRLFSALLYRLAHLGRLLARPLIHPDRRRGGEGAGGRQSSSGSGR